MMRHIKFAPSSKLWKVVICLRRKIIVIIIIIKEKIQTIGGDHSPLIILRRIFLTNLMENTYSASSTKKRDMVYILKLIYAYIYIYIYLLIKGIETYRNYGFVWGYVTGYCFVDVEVECDALEIIYK